MKIIIYLFLIVLCIQVNGQVLSQNKTHGDTVVHEEDFTIELNEFIDKVNTKYHKIREYFVFVVYVYQSDTIGCNVYTVGFIFNEWDLICIAPQYQLTDKDNVIVVSFAPNVKEKKISEFDMVKIDPEQAEVIKNKLLKESEGYITGVFYGLNYRKCGDELEIVFYDNADLIPKERSIFRIYTIGGKVEMIKGGN